MAAKRRTPPAKSAAPAPVVPPVEGNLLRVGLPKGSLQEATLELMRHAGFDFRTIERSYHASCDDPEVRGILVRAQEMARYVEQGLFDCGLTGLDWVKENRAKVVHVCDLVYSKVSRRPVRWVLAVPNASPIKSVEDLQGKRIATEAVNLVKDYLRRHKVTADVEFSWGATEIKVPELVDAIVDVTETGSSLRAHNLRIVDTVLESWTQFIASHEAMRNPWKRDKIESIAMLLQAAMAAEGRVGLKMNAPRKLLPSILEILPALKSPTISTLSNSEFVAVETILEKAQVRELIPKLKRAGASGIIEYPLNKVVE